MCVYLCTKTGEGGHRIAEWGAWLGVGSGQVFVGVTTHIVRLNMFHSITCHTFQMKSNKSACVYTFARRLAREATDSRCRERGWALVLDLVKSKDSMGILSLVKCLLEWLRISLS